MTDFLSKKFKYLLSTLILLAGAFSFPAAAFSATTQSMEIVRHPVTPGKVFIADSGYITYVPGLGLSKNFYTKRACPVNFTPYIELSVKQIAGDHSGRQPIIEYGACVLAKVLVGTQTNPSYYYVLYVSTRRYSSLITQGGNLQLQNAYAHDYTGITGLSWTLYCYPQNLPPPVNVQWSSGLNGYIYSGHGCDSSPYF